MRPGAKPYLIVLTDALSSERTEHELTEGALLSDELMRLFPGGLEGEWRLYCEELAPDNEIMREAAAALVIERNDLFLIVRMPGTPDIWINLAITAFLTIAARALTPSPPRRPNVSTAESRESGSNQLAAQTNVLRPGARVPEILGRVRSFPDLLTVPVEWWTNGVTQTIQQWFVLGRGAYLIDELKLGDTPIAATAGTNWDDFAPGEAVPYVDVVRRAATVDSISLDAQKGTPPISGATFTASSKTMSVPERVALILDTPIRIAGTAGVNDGTFWVMGVPPESQTTGPYVYTLEGNVADQVNVNPIIDAWMATFDGNVAVNYEQALDVAFIKFNLSVLSAGDAIAFQSTGKNFHGILISVDYWYSGEEFLGIYVAMNTLYGVRITFSVDEYNVATHLRTWNHSLGPPTALRAGVEALADDPPIWTEWHSVPMQNPQQIWLDVQFPQGLAFFKNAARIEYAVTVEAEFKRRGASAAQATLSFAHSAATTGRLQWTEKIYVNRPAGTPLPSGAYEITLPAGDPVIEVRMRRTTPLKADTATEQYVDEVRWQSLRGMLRLPSFVYPDVTIIQLALTNSRSALSIGEAQFNVVATRILPTWTAGGGWQPAAASRRWADSFVQRCKASDGANRSDAEIDLAGIYALQAELDAIDVIPAQYGPLGAAGQISMTLDQLQDIDAELAQIADVARAVVYRVGKKIFAVRDKSGTPPIALFNARTKTAEAESIAMRMKSDDENDAVSVQWVDEFSEWKVRDYQYGDTTPANVLRVSTQCANWPQAFRRARYELARLKYRRETLSVNVTEDGRICRPGDVVHVTDDVGNLALAAGEVINVAGTQLVLDRDVSFTAPGTYSILVRDLEGRAVDAIPCTAVAGSSNRVQLSRAPVGVTIKGRDEALGTLYAFFNDAAVTVRKWLLSSVEASGQRVQLGGQNYSELVYSGDTAALEPRPPLPGSV